MCGIYSYLQYSVGCPEVCVYAGVRSRPGQLGYYGFRWVVCLRELLCIYSTNIECLAGLRVFVGLSRKGMRKWINNYVKDINYPA